MMRKGIGGRVRVVIYGLFLSLEGINLRTLNRSIINPKVIP
jgi:hypothetical protein